MEARAMSIVSASGGGRVATLRRSFAWLAALIAFLVLTGCAFPAGKGSGPPGVGRDEPFFTSVPDGVVATVASVSGRLEQNPYGAFGGGLYVDYLASMFDEARIVDVAVDAAGNFAFDLPTPEAGRLPGSTLTIPMCEGGGMWFLAGGVIVSDTEFIATPRGPARAGYVQARTQKLTTVGDVGVQLFYVFSAEAYDRSCEGDIANPDVDLRLRPGWNIVTIYSREGIGMHYRTGAPGFTLPWSGPNPARLF